MRVVIAMIVTTAFALMTVCIAGCVPLHEHRSVASPPRSEPVLPAAGRPPLLALVLSGGSARAFAHIGVIKVLEEAGIEPDIVVGSSAGSLVGVAYGAGMNAQQLMAAARSFDAVALQDFVLPNLGLPLMPGELGFIHGERLQAYVEQLVSNRPLEALPRRVAVVATDLQTGLPMAFTRGNTGLAVRASASVPGIFVPPSIEGRLYVDGQVSSPVPVTVAHRLGARIVIAVDATFPAEQAEISSTVGVLFQSFTIATQRIAGAELTLATLVIRPEIMSRGQLGLSDREWIMAAGEKAARAQLPALLAIRKRIAALGEKVQ